MKKEKLSNTHTYCLVITKRGGGLAVTEGEVLLSDVLVTKEHPPDAADQALERIARLIERRFLR